MAGSKQEYWDGNKCVDPNFKWIPVEEDRAPKPAPKAKKTPAQEVVEPEWLSVIESNKRFGCNLEKQEQYNTQLGMCVDFSQSVLPQPVAAQPAPVVNQPVDEAAGLVDVAISFIKWLERIAEFCNTNNIPVTFPGANAIEI